MVAVGALVSLTRGGVDRGLAYRQLACSSLLASHHILRGDESVVPGLASLTANQSFELQVLDTGSAAFSAVAAFLHSDVSALVGGGSSGVTSQLVALAKATDTALVGYRSTSTTLRRASNSHFARTVPSDAAATAAMARLVRTFAWRHVAVIAEQSLWAESFVSSFLESARRENVTVIASSTFDAASPASRALAVRELTDSGASVVIGVMGDAAAGPLLRSARDCGALGAGTAWLFADGVSPAALSEQAVAQQLEGITPLSELLRGSLSLAASAEGSESHGRFLRAWQAEGAQPTGACRNPLFDEPAAFAAPPLLPAVAAYLYDAVISLAVALARAGPPHSGAPHVLHTLISPSPLHLLHVFS